ANGDCAATKVGPSPGTDPAGARAAAAKTLAAALGAKKCAWVVPDVGLYDPSWIPADLRAGRAIVFHMSAGSIVAADEKRGPYRERQDDAATAGATAFLAAAPRADVLRLDAPGFV